MTERAAQATERMARVSCARDMTVLSCGTLHYAVQLFELQCSYTVHEHCLWALFKKKKKKEYKLNPWNLGHHNIHAY